MALTKVRAKLGGKMDNTEIMLRRLLLNQAQIMAALMRCTKDEEMNNSLKDLTADTLDLLFGLM